MLYKLWLFGKSSARLLPLPFPSFAVLTLRFVIRFDFLLLFVNFIYSAQWFYCVVCILHKYTQTQLYTTPQRTTTHHTNQTRYQQNPKQQQTVESFSTIRNSWPNFRIVAAIRFQFVVYGTKKVCFVFWISLEKTKSYIQFEWTNAELPIKPKSNTDWLKSKCRWATEWDTGKAVIAIKWISKVFQPENICRFHFTEN